MRKFFNTLYITTQKTYLAKERETVAIKNGEVSKKIPLHNLDSIVCFGNIRVSPYLIKACSENGISISYLSEHGQYLGRFAGAVSGNVLLRRRQYRIADYDDLKLPIAKNIITGKLNNSNTVLKRFIRDNPDNSSLGEVEKIIHQLKNNIDKLQKVEEVSELRGIEGASASLYYSVFDHLILSQKDSFFFHGRNRRPPLDPVNALLSFLYSILHHDLTSACESVGLDPAVGFIHADRPGRYGLALDLMEEFRAFLADRISLSLINRKQVCSADFEFQASGAVILSDKAKKTLLETYQNRKNGTIVHPYLQEKMKISNLFFYQALLLCRFIRGDIDGYPPFLWR